MDSTTKSPCVSSLFPAAWYAVGDEENERRILVFDDQLSGYERMADDAEFFMNSDISPEDIIRKYFGGFVTLPSEKDVAAFAGALKTAKYRSVIY